MEQEIIILEGEVATKNIMIESLQRELESARKTIASLCRQIDRLREIDSPVQFYSSSNLMSLLLNPAFSRMSA